MYLIDMKCSQGHKFEGQYASRGEYEMLRHGNEITCPLCHGRREHTVEPMLTTGGVQTSKTQARQKAEHERRYVGKNFAEQAIDMHEGRVPYEHIEGTCTEAEHEELHRRGVPHTAVPVLVVKAPEESEKN